MDGFESRFQRWLIVRSQFLGRRPQAWVRRALGAKQIPKSGLSDSYSLRLKDRSRSTMKATGPAAHATRVPLQS